MTFWGDGLEAMARMLQSIRGQSTLRIQLFRERLSEKVHGTIPKGLVGGFEFTVLQTNLKEWHAHSKGKQE